MSDEQERVRQGIAAILVAHDEEMTLEAGQLTWNDWKQVLETEPWANGKHSGDCTKEPMTCMRCLVGDYLRQVEQILSLKDEQGKELLAVLADDQSLPEPHGCYNWDWHEKSIYSLAQQNMMEAGFVKVIKKGG